MDKIIGNTTATPYPRPDWNQDDSTKADYIKNKPDLGGIAGKSKIDRDDLNSDIQESLDKADTAIQSIDGLATEDYVDEKIADIVNSAPEALDTLSELAEALGNDDNFANTVLNQLSGKVDKVDGKGLSSNDFTTEEKNKLSNIEDGAEVNIQSDWNEDDTTKDSYIHNKPDINNIYTTIARLADCERYYGDANIVPSDASLFNFVVYDGLTVAAIESVNTNISGDIVIPYECELNGNIYKVGIIGYNAFYSCNNIVSITIPNSVTSISDNAFYGCNNLINVVIPDGVTSIGDGVFYECSGLTSITIPDSVISIGAAAFLDSGIQTMILGKGIKYINTDAFSFYYSNSDIYFKGTKEQWDSINIASNIHSNVYYAWTKPSYSYGDQDLTAGVSALETGSLYFVYE